MIVSLHQNNVAKLFVTQLLLQEELQKIGQIKQQLQTHAMVQKQFQAEFVLVLIHLSKALSLSIIIGL